MPRYCFRNIAETFLVVPLAGRLPDADEATISLLVRSSRRHQLSVGMPPFDEATKSLGEAQPYITLSSRCHVSIPFFLPFFLFILIFEGHGILGIVGSVQLAAFAAQVPLIHPERLGHLIEPLQCYGQKQTFRPPSPPPQETGPPPPPEIFSAAYH